MEIISQDPIICIRFTIDDYSDALNLSQSEYATALAMGTLDAMKQARYNNWKQSVIERSSQPSPELTKEEIQIQLAMLIESEESLAAMKQELAAKLEAVKV